MNIFFVDENPVIAAKSLANTHAVKMILESAQMLSTAHHVCPGVTYNLIKDKIYKKTHMNHPSTKWVRENSANYSWLVLHALALCEEYTSRYGRRHATQDKITLLGLSRPSIPLSFETTLPPCAMDDEYKLFKEPNNFNEVILNYRNYYNVGKKHLHSWKNCSPPDWILEDK